MEPRKSNDRKPPMETRRDAARLLASARLRRTDGRVETLSVLLRADHPLSHQEIQDQTALSRVGLYRALESFREAGIVHRVEAGDRLWRYAVCAHGHNIHCHPHFQCVSCGEVRCLDRVSLPAGPEAPPGYVIQEVEVYLKGLCPRCARAIA